MMRRVRWAASEREVLEVRAAGFRDPQREAEQARQHVVVAARQPTLDQEGTEFCAVQPEPGRLLGDLGTADVDGRRVVDQVLLDAVAVEAGEHDQLQRDGRCGQSAGFELAGIQLHVRPPYVGQGV